MDAFRATLSSDEQKLGADIIRKALPYPLRLIANNAGVNGSVVMQRILDGSQANAQFGYNAATDTYEDLMEAGIIDPTKVRRGSASPPLVCRLHAHRQPGPGTARGPLAHFASAESLTANQPVPAFALRLHPDSAGGALHAGERRVGGQDLPAGRRGGD